jgi:uncharacterized repeat protein (TIGR01451 family)
MAEGIPNYDELKLRIERGEEGSYRVLALGPDGSTANGTFALPFNEMELDNFVLRVGQPRRGTRAFRSSQMEEAKRFGSRLFDAVLQHDVRDVYLGARRSAESEERGLRVTLSLTEVPELMEVPWEFMYERPSFLSQSIYTPLVRSLDLKSVRPPRKLTLPLQILGMVSRPEGYDTLDVDQERHKLENALEGPAGEGLVVLRWLNRATLSELERTVGAPDDIHVVHYIGHGAYDQRSQSGTLLMENERGGPYEVTGEELGSILTDERSLRLVVLNSCEGARSSHVDPFSGVASSLVEFGLPAVVGMQFEITDDAAIIFAERLYTALGQGFPVDAAIAHARKAIFAAGHDVEFGTPVLFLRTTDARLFDIEPASPQQHPQQPLAALGDFNVQVEHVPPEPRPGDEITWRLTIQNSGASKLTDVTVRKSDGDALADGLELAPGSRHLIRWSETLEPGVRHLLTVTACDERGSRISEQITARAASADPGEMLTVREPTEQRSPPREPTISRTLYRPGGRDPLGPGAIETAEGWAYRKEASKLLGALAKGEAVYKITYANRRETSGPAGLLAVTDRRLIFAYKGGVDQWEYAHIAKIDFTPGMAYSRLVIEQRNAGSTALLGLLNKGALSEAADLAREAIELTGHQSPREATRPVAASDDEEKWAIDVIESGDRVRSLRIRLSHQTHVLTYRWGFLKDTFELDGMKLYDVWSLKPEGYEIALTDGDSVRTAICKVNLTGSGLAIKELSLHVSGRLLYQG